MKSTQNKTETCFDQSTELNQEKNDFNEKSLGNSSKTPLVFFLETFWIFVSKPSMVPDFGVFCPE